MNIVFLGIDLIKMFFSSVTLKFNVHDRMQRFCVPAKEVAYQSTAWLSCRLINRLPLFSTGYEVHKVLYLLAAMI